MTFSNNPIKFLCFAIQAGQQIWFLGPAVLDNLQKSTGVSGYKFAQVFVYYQGNKACYNFTKINGHNRLLTCPGTWYKYAGAQPCRPTCVVKGSYSKETIEISATCVDLVVKTMFCKMGMKL